MPYLLLRIKYFCQKKKERKKEKKRKREKKTMTGG
jgi:hypothetical protein